VTQADAVQACEGRACYLPTGNLLIGRGHLLTASSTCGLNHSQQYCIPGRFHNPRCYPCDSRQPWSKNNTHSHNITNIIASSSDKRLKKWWQAENLEEEVSIQLDFNAEFQFTHLIILFKTFRPKSMYIERSVDFGKTWHKYRYFAENCSHSFPGIPRGPVQSLEDYIICEEKYSNALPRKGGEVSCVNRGSFCESCSASRICYNNCSSLL